MTVKVNAQLFAAAATCAASDEARSHLRGVRVAKHPIKGVTLAATDGHRLIVILDVEGECDKPTTVMLDKEGLKACRESDGKSRLIVNALGFPSIGGVQYNGPVFVAGEYPDWRRVVPVQGWRNVPASFNGRYLATFSKIADGLCEKSGAALRVLTGSDDSSVALILFPAYSDAFGILMPMRADVGGALPFWMKAVMEPFERAKKCAEEKAARDDAKEARRKKKK